METLKVEVSFTNFVCYLSCSSGVSLGEGTGATMSDDEDDIPMDFSLDQSGTDAHDMMGFGPLLPTESERSLMERVRQELKIELKQVPFSWLKRSFPITLQIKREKQRTNLYEQICGVEDEPDLQSTM